MWKYSVQTDRPHMTIWRMHTTCWIHKATNTNSKYVTLLFYCNCGCTTVFERYVIHT